MAAYILCSRGFLGGLAAMSGWRNILGLVQTSLAVLMRGTRQSALCPIFTCYLDLCQKSQTDCIFKKKPAVRRVERNVTLGVLNNFFFFFKCAHRGVGKTHHSQHTYSEHNACSLLTKMTDHIL